MSAEKVVLKEAILTNNCPECFSNTHLRLSLQQTVHKNRLFTRTENRIDEVLTCEQCNTRIYPIQWTPDIDRVVSFYTKTQKVKPKLRFTPLFWILVSVLIATLSGLIYLLFLS